MFGLGGPELLVIGGIVLLIFGPAKLPALAGSIGKSIRSFKKEVKEVGDSVKLDETVDAVKAEVEPEPATKA